MSSEQITRELHTLSDEFLLTPLQLETIMQVTPETLKNMRVNGDGPPFVKIGDGEKSPVRYPLGGYRKWKAAHTFKNTSQISVCRFMSMADFLSTGMWDEEYIVARDVGGNQWDFWEAIRAEADIVKVQWKSMDEILDGFRSGAKSRSALDEAKEWGAPIDPGILSRRRRSED
jgi:hypothetical protein